MRKFLGSLSTIAIACSLMLSTIDANPYQRGEGTKLGSIEVDDHQTNNLINLSRDKRADCVNMTSVDPVTAQILNTAAVNAAIGSAVPGIGAAVGAAVGAISAATGIYNSEVTSARRCPTSKN